MAISRDTPFLNDPFIVVAEAYKRLWNKPYIAVYAQHQPDNEDSYGLTACPDTGVPIITIFAEHTINDQIETFAHELAHVAVGIEHEHDHVFRAALLTLKAMYSQVYDEMLGEQNGKDSKEISKQIQANN